MKIHARGSKHICQDVECAKPFYDLGKSTFACPHCGRPFDTAADDASSQSSDAGAYVPGRRRKAPVYEIVSPELAVQQQADAAEAEGVADHAPAGATQRGDATNAAAHH